MENYLQEQINLRITSDQQLYEAGDRILTEGVDIKQRRKADALRKATSNEKALDCILSIVNMDMDRLKNIEDEDVLYHVVELKDRWWRRPASMMIAFDEAGRYTAIIPGKIYGCYYFNEKGKKCKIDADNCRQFTQAYVISPALPPQPVTKWQLIKMISRSLSIVEVVCYFVLMAAAIRLGMFFPELISNLLSFIETEDSAVLSVIISAAVVILLTQLAVTSFKMLAIVIDKKLVRRFSIMDMNAGLHRILKLDPAQLKGHNPTSLWRAVNSNLKEFTTLMVESWTVIPITAGFVIAYLCQAWKMLGEYTWVLLIVLSVTTILTFILVDLGCRHYDRENEIKVDNNDFNVSVIDGMEKIRSMHAEKRIYHLWSKIYSDYVREHLIRRYYNKIIYATADLLPFMIAAILIFVAVRMGIGSGSFVTAILVIGLVSAYTSEFGLQVGYIQMANREWNAAKFIFEAGWADDTTKRKARYFDGSLSCDKLTFSYSADDRPVINNISFDVQPGEYVGIVGSSGCGKSTLLKLLLGMETPQRGTVMYGSNSLENTDRRSIIKHIGIVMQDDTLIPGTLRQNLALTSGHVTETDMWDALEAVGIADLIRSYPYGLDTSLSAFSNGMSKGQMQRILIARSIISKPKMLIFDEATSALDNINQKQIKNILDSMQCTRIMVAHRLSTIKDCDKILVMDQGKIVEQGTYDELMAQEGLFHELAKYQTIDV